MSVKFRFRTLSEYLENFQQKASEVSSSQSKRVGYFREEVVREVLQEMKEKRRIIDFLQTGRFSRPDVIYGVDFYVIVMVDGRRRVLPISVVNPNFFEKERRKHPKNFFVGFKSDISSKEKAKELIRLQLLTIISNL